MNARASPAPGASYSVTLDAPDDFAGWRDAARQAIQVGIAPAWMHWRVAGESAATLFALDDVPLPPPPSNAVPPRSSRAFLEVARSAILHDDPARFDLLYRTLWRLQRAPRLMDDATDADVRRLADLARAVRRDIHKMRAFVRFRSVEERDGPPHYVAWFEPCHHILRANAAFFTGRFANMRWSILTPRGTLHWDGAVLREGPPAHRSDAPEGDPAEDLWRSYYASIFNPARLKVGAMLKEMPRKYWKNMPETALIPALIAGAQAREAEMVALGQSRFEGKPPESLPAVATALNACRRCAIGCLETRAVAGEGPPQAALMILGEQPGDQEEAAGRPFIGPAGQLLRAHLAQAGIDSAFAYVTNAVKHFKFTAQARPGGKSVRLHQTPTAGEIDHCRWWLDAERALVRPRHILALGASAARGVLGKTVSINAMRGTPHCLPDGSTLWITVHPAHLLRLPDAARAEEEARFSADLVQVARALSA